MDSGEPSESSLLLQQGLWLQAYTIMTTSSAS